ncbi:carbohydrate kinase family protein [Thermomonospora umbrina]|uniref:Sugar/nucleoside kinase (Ribokinase family) n=1 Tax=Thermomonospora umbrina TaxID=111806 RepID=A0A3D9SS35_9ACTN|nr:sugar kinase [Thermomonospora umbrina]REE95434.1 sugar/nucleoside kinase (ribokinase family) [Thermomonospora umbrina]
MTRVVVVGDLMTDTLARAAHPLAKGSDTPAAVTMHGGGSAANVASWLATEGTEVAFVGRRGSDIAGRNRDMELMGMGVDARLVMDPERPTGSCVVLVTHKGDRTMLSDPGANAALLPEDIPADLFSQGSHLHLSGYALLNEGSRKAAKHALGLGRKAQMSISVDAASSSPLKRVGAEPFLEWTQGARLLVVNTDEAEVLTGREEPQAAAKVLTAWYPQVVIKMGGDGALWYTNGRPEPIVAAAEPIDKIVDGTGAGDAFVAGFLPPWLDGKPPAEALAAGCGLAARAMSHIGARPRLDIVDNEIKQTGS